MELADVPAARARLDAAELALIDRARRGGATWAEIARTLGLASRQAAEQRRHRLAAAVLRPPAGLDDAYGERIAALREAAVDLHRRIGADRRWDRRFTRAALVRETLAAVPGAPAGSLFALAGDVVADLGAEAAAGLPGPARAAVERLRGALAAAYPVGLLDTRSLNS